VIDDGANDLQLIEKILAQHNQYHPILVQGGRAGWEALNAQPPHAIILDLFMPELDGFSILERLRGHPHLRNIPVLVITSGDVTGEQRQQLNKFGRRLISKASLNEAELIESIEQVLEQIGS
jgi:CheY-like chemotaxis protein